MMRGYILLVVIVTIYLILGAFNLFMKSSPEISGWNGSVLCVVYADGRYWKIDEYGFLRDIADASDILRYSVVSGVKLLGMRVADENMEVIRKLKSILNNPVTSEVSIEKKYVITVKGIVLYFQRWEDLLKYYDAFTKKIEHMAPRSSFFLHESGKLAILGGD